MQSRRHYSASKSKRRGFTLIELLVVISIIATLMALILPAIQNAREAARRTQCLNNIRNVSLAALSFASSNKSKLPALAYFPANPVSGSNPRIEGRSWAVELLPFLDQQGVYDRWNKDIARTAQVAETNIYVDVFACPNDDSAFQQNRGLSYVANAGVGAGSFANTDGNLEHTFVNEAIDWDADTTVTIVGTSNDDGDNDITRALGVFHAEFAGVASTRNTSASVGKIYDGTGNTLMFGENTKAVDWGQTGTRAIGFFLPVDPAAVVTANTSPVELDALNRLDEMIPSGDTPFPNDEKNAADGQAASLNSNHPGIVVVSFCDGSARTLSDGIDTGVYASLVTPGGTRLRNSGETNPRPLVVESPVSGDSY